MEPANHALMQDSKNPSIVNPYHGKPAKEQETKRCRHSLNELDAEKFAAPVDQGPRPNKDNLC